MSYEGYTQFLCSLGHYWVKDCYTLSEDSQCPTCGGLPFWENMVNITNGSFEGEERIDGYIELEEDVITKCETCGSVLEIRYKIPQ